MPSLDTSELGFAQLPHFSTHAVEFFTAMASRLPSLGIAPTFEKFLASCLQESVKFLLPDNGYLFADHDYQPAMFELQRLPYPVCALEFRADRTLYAEGSGLHHAEKRIALAFDPRALSPRLFAEFLALIEHRADQLPARSIVMASVYEANQVWGASLGFALLDLDAEGPLKLADARQRMAQGALNRMSELALASGRVQGNPSPYGLPCTFYTIPQRARLVGQSVDDAYAALYVDVLDEVRATYEFLAAINCSNVATVQVDAPMKLNLKRMKNGKTVFFPYKLLDLAPASAYRPGAAGSSGVVMRKHLRRGHLRRIGEGVSRKTIWINSTTVNPWRKDDCPPAQVYLVRPGESGSGD